MMKPETVARQVTRLPLGIVNAYVVADARGRWFLVDSGMAGKAANIEHMVRSIPGLAPRPDFIVLTHGHFDHAGSARELAGEWDVPVLVHPLDVPYVTTGRDYPPPDPTVGGPMGLFMRFWHKPSSVKVGGRVRPLSENGTLPGFDEWRIIHTPGHTPGHVSLFRESDRTLIAGDAIATVDSDSFVAFVTQERRVSRPVAAATYDWEAARRSVQSLAALFPSTIAAGHGQPVHAPEAARALERLSNRFRAPAQGRYVRSPARFDEHGPTSIPGPVDDALPRQAAIAAAGIIAVAGIAAWIVGQQHRRHKRHHARLAHRYRHGIEARHRHWG